MSRTDPPPTKKKTPPSKIASGKVESADVDVTIGEGEISLDELDLAEGQQAASSAFERITVTPGISEREYVARMMRQAPSDRAPPAQGAGERESGTIFKPPWLPPSPSPLPPSDPLETLTLDLPDSALALASNVRTPAPSPLPPVEDGEGQRRSSGAPHSFRPAAGDALELVDVRSKSVRPPLAPNITMRAVRDRFDVGDFSGALILAEGILESEPESVDALLYAEHCRDVLKQMYISRLGGMNRVPQVAVTDEQLRWLAIDHRAGFLLSLVDGRSSFEEVLDVSGMSAVDALRLLMDLLQQNVIKIT
jgi:hypothetical protein